MRRRRNLAMLLVWAGGAVGAPIGQPQARALPLALPDASHTRLVLQEEAVAWLRALRGPVALVSIIGPYRSGKSFLLNRLLNVDCDAGFAVGHRRQTQTKGVWIWSAPMPAPADAPSDPNAPTILFLDTEGIEGAGATGVYDDRIFSFAALVSSVLCYNVAETLKEGDIEKLSFVVELATEFWTRVGGSKAGAAEEEDDRGRERTGTHAWAPPSLLWLIQRDFLQGSEAAEHVASTLRPVANAHNDEHVARLNQIRSSLSVFRNIEGIGIPQPTLDRTRLCDLAAANQLPQPYVQKLAAVAAYVRAHAKPRGFGSGSEGGAGLADLAERALEALNSQEIPSVASVVTTFNSQLVLRCAKAHAAALAGLRLPVAESDLDAVHAAALRDATARLLAQSFGGNQSAAELVSMAEAARAARRDANFKASHEACAAGWAKCEPLLAALRSAVLPSRARLDDLLLRCNASLAGCAGPAAPGYRARAADAAAAARRDVLEQYEQKLGAVCLVGSLALVAAARFALRSAVLELVGWAALFLLEVAPRLDVLGGGRHARLLAPDSPRAAAALGYYELLVYNSYYDLDRLLGYAPLLVVLALVARLALARRRRRLAHAHARPPARTPGDERRERERRERGLDSGSAAFGGAGGGGGSGGGGGGFDVVIKTD